MELYYYVLAAITTLIPDSETEIRSCLRSRESIQIIQLHTTLLQHLVNITQHKDLRYREEC